MMDQAASIKTFLHMQYLHNMMMYILLFCLCADNLGCHHHTLTAWATSLDWPALYELTVYLQAGAIALIQSLLQHHDAVHLGIFMAAKVANVANLRSGELIRRRLADHSHFLPAWLGKIGALASDLPSVDQLHTHAHPSPQYLHLLHLVDGLGGMAAEDDVPGHAGIMLSGMFRMQ